MVNGMAEHTLAMSVVNSIIILSTKKGNYATIQR